MSASQLPKTADNSVLRRLGGKPVINACGIYTDLGGSRLSPGVWAAMEEANRNFVRLTDLLDFSGRHIAQQLGDMAAGKIQQIGQAYEISVRLLHGRPDARRKPRAAEVGIDAAGVDHGLAAEPAEHGIVSRLRQLAGAHG